MDYEFESITPWNGEHDTGRDARLKLDRNFAKIKSNFEELVGSRYVTTNFFARLFAPEGEDGAEVDVNNMEAVITAVRVKFGLYTDSYLSAKGNNPESGSTVSGASALVDLSDVAISNPQDGQILSWNGTKWVNADAPSAGLDEAALAEYLTTNHYAKTTDIPSLEGYATTDWASGQFALKTVAINAGTGLTGGGNLSASRTLSLATVGTAGTYTKVTVDAYGRVTGHSSLAAGDIPALAISKITGLQAALDGKMDAADFEELFEKVYVSGYGYAIRAKLALYTDSWMSAKGSNPDAGSTASGGIDEEELAEYLTTHGYATQTWVNQQGFLKSSALSGYLTQTTADSLYVNVSGDTMTGRLTISTSDNKQLYLNGTSQAQIAFLVNGTTQSLVGYSSTSGAFLQIGSHWINMRSDGTACVDNQYTIWHSGNDGSGSGIDADLLDGTHKSGLFTAMTYAGSTLSLTIGGVKKSVNIETSAVIPTVTVSSSSSRNLSVNVGGSTDYVNDLYATYLGGTTKQGLFTGLTYSSNRLSVTIGGTTKSVTINAGSSGSYLPLSGGTISGDLTVSGQATFNTQSVHNYGILTSNIYTNQSMYVRYNGSNTARLYCNWASGMIISVDGANTEFTNTYIATGTTTASAFDLGISNRRWRTIYSVNSLNTSSDLRLKDVRAAIPLTVAQVAAAPSFLYRWKKGADTALHAGSSAQYWRQALPQAVTEGADGYLAMEYDRIALAAAIATARAVETLDQRVTRLEKENARLRRRLRQHKINV